jgi:hypothetical protein
MLLYMGIFISAVAAFALMALREYLQDVLGVSDEGLIAGDQGIRLVDREGTISSKSPS